MDVDLLKDMLESQFQKVDIENAKNDIATFLKDNEKASLKLWSNDYFVKTIERLEVTKPPAIIDQPPASSTARSQNTKNCKSKSLWMGKAGIKNK